MAGLENVSCRFWAAFYVEVSALPAALLAYQAFRVLGFYPRTLESSAGEAHLDVGGRKVDEEARLVPRVELHLRVATNAWLRLRGLCSRFRDSD